MELFGLPPVQSYQFLAFHSHHPLAADPEKPAGSVDTHPRNCRPGRGKPLPPQDFPQILGPEATRRLRIEIKDQVFHQIRMESAAVMAVDSSKEGFVRIHVAERGQDPLVHLILIQRGRPVAPRMVGEFRLQMKGREYVGAHFLRPQHPLHALDHMFDLITAFFHEYLEEPPGPPIQIADIHSPTTQEMQSTLVKTVEMALPLRKLLGRRSILRVPGTAPVTVAFDHAADFRA